MPSLNKRDWGDGWSNSGSARWAFFAIFIALIILVVVGTLRVNKKRSRQGVQPIYGTRWLTPPSYGQSQTVYNTRNEPDITTNYVPTYTERAAETDMGYYDNQGTFHANPNAKAPIPEAHVRSTSASEGVPLATFSSIDGDDFYRRPVRGPARDTNFEPDSSTTGDSEARVASNVPATARFTSLHENVTSTSDVAPPPGPPPANGHLTAASGNINDTIRPEQR